jgi:hypothetical protein
MQTPEGSLIQQSQLPVRENPDAGVGPGVLSEDARFSVAETARLQGQAQRRIDAGRHDTIGETP